MTAANSLLDALRIPRQVVVEHEGAELQIESFGCGIGRNQNVGFAPEVVQYRGLAVEIGIGLQFESFLFLRMINLIGLRIEIVAVHHDHPELLPQEFKQESLRLEKFGEDHCFPLAGAESLFEGAKQRL